MKCEEVEAVMIDYLDRNLESATLSSVEAHLVSCERCTDEARELQSIMKSIASEEMEKPDETLRINFYHILQSEITKLNTSKKSAGKKRLGGYRISPFAKIAASIALLVAGAFLGKIIQPGVKTNPSAAQLNELQGEVKEMKKMLMFTLLNEESPSQRIKAVNYAEEIANPDQKVVQAIINTLNNDNNVNVRLAAVYSLAKFANDPSVRDSLVKSLERQKEPIIQILLMNILTEKKETKAIEAMKKIISDKGSMKEVKETAEKGIKILL